MLSATRLASSAATMPSTMRGAADFANGRMRSSVRTVPARFLFSSL
ncbi:hypothetical protein N136_00958 [Leifsonia aquatica ATCC 14665]|uniref:Uncharacterized protein n=1 Tax=Leifsonia aquatica ATCC 14665 TaxID=1358026 RepID=U2TDA9_LEIAQ|nr:hypothetical protein N136_00958 [Leifsonia aquatica ATCC 14665]